MYSLMYLMYVIIVDELTRKIPKQLRCLAISKYIYKGCAFATSVATKQNCRLKLNICVVFTCVT